MPSNRRKDIGEMRFTSENVMEDIECALRQRTEEEWSNTDRLLLKCQLHIAGLQREIQQLEDQELKELVKSFFNDYLNLRETSASGRTFAPIHISNCRCMTLDPMSKLLNRMRELSGADRPPKEE